MERATDELRTAWSRLKSHVDELTSERQHYVEFFEHLPDACLVTDGASRIAEINGAAVDLFQQRRGALRGKSLAGLVAPGERRDFRRRLERLSEPAQWRTSFIVQGRPVPVDLRARPLPAARGVIWSLRAAE